MGKTKIFWHVGSREISPKWISDAICEKINNIFSF